MAPYHEIVTTNKPPHLRYPHHLAVKALCKRFNADPKFQYKLHLVATYIWLANMAAALAAFIFAPHLWSQFSVLYLVVVSLYANFATDYGALPGAEAAIQSEALRNDKET